MRDEVATGVAALAAAHEALADAGARLAAAEAGEWVSSAADAYRDLLADARADVVRTGAELGTAATAVIAHLRAAEAARLRAEDVAVLDLARPETWGLRGW